MKLLIKLAIAALLANAAYRIGSEYLTYIKFRDAIRDAAMFKATDDVELRKKIMDLSDEYDVPLVDEALIIQDVLLYAQLRGNNQGIVKLVGPGLPKDPKAVPIAEEAL